MKDAFLAANFKRNQSVEFGSENVLDAIIVKDALEYTFTESYNGPEDMASLVDSLIKA